MGIPPNSLKIGKLCVMFLSKILRVGRGSAGSPISAHVAGAVRDYRVIIVSECAARPELRITPADSSLNTRRLSAGNLGFDRATTFSGFDHFSSKAVYRQSDRLGRFLGDYENDDFELVAPRGYTRTG